MEVGRQVVGVGSLVPTCASLQQVMLAAEQAHQSIWYFKGRASIDGADCMGVGDRVYQPLQTEINTSLKAQCC